MYTRIHIYIYVYIGSRVPLAVQLGRILEFAVAFKALWNKYAYNHMYTCIYIYIYMDVHCTARCSPTLYEQTKSALFLTGEAKSSRLKSETKLRQSQG